MRGHRNVADGRAALAADGTIRRQILALSVLAGLGWAVAVIGLLIDPANAQIGGGVAGPVFVAVQILLGIVVWVLVGRLGRTGREAATSGDEAGRHAT